MSLLRSRLVRRSFLTLPLAVVALFAGAASAQAATATWNGSMTTAWNNPANWTPATVPVDNTFDVVIPARENPDGPVVITGIPEVTVGAFTVQSAGLSVQQSLTAAGSDPITVEGNLTLAGGSYAALNFDVEGATTILDGSDASIVYDGGSITTANGTPATLDSSGMFTDFALVANDDLAIAGSPTIAQGRIEFEGTATGTLASGTTLTIREGLLEGASGADPSQTVMDAAASADIKLQATVIRGVTIGDGIDLELADLGGDSSRIQGGDAIQLDGDTTVTGNFETGAGSSIYNDGRFSVSNLVVVGGVGDAGVFDNGFNGVLESPGSDGESASFLMDVTTVGAIQAGNGDLDFGAHSIELYNGGQLQVLGDSTVTAGAINMAGNGFGQAEISGDGTVNADAIAVNGGRIRPDISTTATTDQKLTLKNATFAPESILDIALRSTSEYNPLELIGTTAKLDGTIELYTEGIDFPAGSEFRLVTSPTNNLTGGFASVDGGGSSGTYFARQQSPSATVLRVGKSTIAVAPGTVVPGDAFSVTGTGYIAGEVVEVSLGAAYGESGDGLATVQVTTGADGSYATSVPVPATTAPSSNTVAHSIVAYGLQSNGFISTPVTISPKPVVTTPAPLDTDGDGLVDTVDCAPLDAKRPARGLGVLDTDCNGVNDALQPIVKFGTKGNDKITGGSKNDKISGGAGNDIIDGGGGNDRLSGGTGNDKVSGGTGNDTIDGGAGNDRVDGGLGNDKVAGGAGNDKVSGGGGSDKLTGGSGNDTITPGTGRDVVSAGSGNDKINARDGLVDKIVCGPGRDVVIADRNDKVATNCEIVKRR